MVYGGADYMGIPWETVIKVLRERLAGESFERLSNYAEWFRDVLAKSKDIVVPNAEDEYIADCVSSYFEFIHSDANADIESFIKKKKDITPAQAAQIYHDAILSHYTRWKNGALMPGIRETQVRRIERFIADRVDRLIDKMFEKLPLPVAVRKNLKFIAAAIFTRESGARRVSDSGVVIAGFGTSDIFPALTAMSIRGCIDGILQWKEGPSISMDKVQWGVIVPFAQTDEVESFLDGVHPDYHRRLVQDFWAILEKATGIVLEEVKGPDAAEKSRAQAAVRKRLKAEFGAYQKELTSFRRAQYSDPILQVLTGTPKDQLASMAEALVNLTSFKRRVSADAETVGGPIDVAVISRSDGLVWVKRKHYFPAELNPQFFSRYNRGVK